MKDVYVYVLTPSLLTQTRTDLLSGDPLLEKTFLKKYSDSVYYRGSKSRKLLPSRKILQ